MRDGPMEGKFSAPSVPSTIGPGAPGYDEAGVSIGNGGVCTWSGPRLTTRPAVPCAWSCCCSRFCRSGSGRLSSPRLMEAIASVSEVWSMDGVLSGPATRTVAGSVSDDEDAGFSSVEGCS
jgi:hypothetical protein